MKKHTTASQAGGSIRWVGLAVGVTILMAGIWLAGRFPFSGAHYGFWSLVPPVVALAMAFLFRDVVAALFVGIVLGGVITDRLNVVQEFFIPSLGTASFAGILIVYLWALGGLIGLWTRTGGARLFADAASHRLVRGPRSAKLFTWAMGLVFHQGGSISTVLTGATVRPVADRQSVSHEELSYIVDSTGSPAATLIPFNVWPIYVASLVAGTVPVLASDQEAIQFFWRSIPFNFYAIFAVSLTFLLASERVPIPMGRQMRDAIRRARETGELDRPGSDPLTAEELTEVRVPEGYRTGLVDFLGPMGTLLGVVIVPFVITFFVQGNRADPSLPVFEAFVLAVLVAMAIALAKGMSLRDVMDGFISGCKGVTIGAIVIALSVTLKSVADALGTAPYVVEALGQSMPAAALPALLLVFTMFIAFSTGTSWGTFAVFFPVAMPLVWAVYPDPTYLALCFGAVVGGSVFGDQCSPISDTTILSSLATGSDLMDHVRTQIPMALLAAGMAAVVYTGVAWFLTS